MSDMIDRQAAIDEIRKCRFVVDGIEKIRGLPSVEPKRETATVSVGLSKGGVTMWYECEACGEPVDQGDTFCSGCGRKLIHE